MSESSCYSAPMSLQQGACTWNNVHPFHESPCQQQKHASQFSNIGLKTALWMSLDYESMLFAVWPPVENAFYVA